MAIKPTPTHSPTSYHPYHDDEHEAQQKLQLLEVNGYYRGKNNTVVIATPFEIQKLFGEIGKKYLPGYETFNDYVGNDEKYYNESNPDLADPIFFKISNLFKQMHPDAWKNYKQDNPNLTDDQILQVIKTNDNNSYHRIKTFAIWYLLIHNDKYLNFYDFSEFNKKHSIQIENHMTQRFKELKKRFNSLYAFATAQAARFPAHNQTFDICDMQKAAFPFVRKFCPLEYRFLCNYIGEEEEEAFVPSSIENESFFSSKTDYGFGVYDIQEASVKLFVEYYPIYVEYLRKQNPNFYDYYEVNIKALINPKN